MGCLQHSRPYCIEDIITRLHLVIVYATHRLHLVIVYATRHDTTRHNTTQHNTTQHNTTQHNTTQHNTTQHNTTLVLQTLRKNQITLAEKSVLLTACKSSFSYTNSCSVILRKKVLQYVNSNLLRRKLPVIVCTMLTKIGRSVLTWPCMTVRLSRQHKNWTTVLWPNIKKIQTNYFSLHRNL